MNRSRGLRTVLSITLAALALLTSAGAANAAKIHNDGPGAVTVWFDCGVACGNYFDLKPGQSASRPGKDGYVWAEERQTDHQADPDGSDRVCQNQFNFNKIETVLHKVHVDSHGEGVLSVDDNALTLEGNVGTAVKWSVYNSSNKLTQQIELGMDEPPVIGEVPKVTCFWGAP